MNDVTWIVERQLRHHPESVAIARMVGVPLADVWEVMSGYGREASAHAEVKQLRAALSRKGYRIRVRRDEGERA